MKISDKGRSVTLPISQATVVPLSDALGHASATVMAQPQVRFAIATMIVWGITLAFASIHYRYVEKRFMSMRKAAPGRAELPGRER